MNHDDDIIMKRGTNDNTFYVIRMRGNRTIGMIGLDSTNTWWAAGADIQRNFDSSHEAIQALIESDDRFLETLDS
jgi:hypothetical protein